MRKVLSDRAELDARIYTFSSSMLKVNGEKINYARFLSDANKSRYWRPADPPQDLKEALARIVPRINRAKIDAFIGEVPYLSDLQREFYRTYLAARFTVLFAAGGRRNAPREAAWGGTIKV